MYFLKNIVLAAAVMAGMLAQPAAATATPFSLTNNGLTARFFGAPQGDAFSVSNAIPFITLHGNTLIDLIEPNNFVGILFSQPLTSLDLDFALNAGASSQFDFLAINGDEFLGPIVDSGSVAGSIPSVQGFDEGHARMTAPSFDAVILSISDPGIFAIDNLMAKLANGGAATFTFETPEPLTLGLFGAGLIGAAAMRRRRKATATL